MIIIKLRYLVYDHHRAINITIKTETKNMTTNFNIRVVLPDFGGPTIAIRMGTTGFGDTWQRNASGFDINWVLASADDRK